MLPTLPFQSLFHPIGNEATNWHDYYGAIAVLSEYAQYDYESVIPLAYWNHGASFPFDTKFENVLTLGVSRNKKLPIWLHREEHREYFKQSSNVHIIGQAYTYVPSISDRLSGSVLIMPGHSLWPDPTIDTSLFRKYVSDVVRIYPPNEKTYVCLNTNCLRNGYWVTEFSEAGYTIVSGSRTDDSNAYKRMKTLFGHFETVVTNILGSHIVYAASEGCRVGIWGTEVIEDP